MAAPQFVPVSPLDRTRAYASPDHIPTAWAADRPGELGGPQPEAEGLGYQGPAQGYALLLAERFADRIVLAAGEHRADAVAGCTVVALKRASRFGRAPTAHDFTVACTVWGFLDPNPPAELVALRGPLFAGASHTTIHYRELREIAHRVPEATLRLPHQQVQSGYPARWRELLGT